MSFPKCTFTYSHCASDLPIHKFCPPKWAFFPQHIFKSLLFHSNYILLYNASYCFYNYEINFYHITDHLTLYKTDLNQKHVSHSFLNIGVTNLNTSDLQMAMISSQLYQPHSSIETLGTLQKQLSHMLTLGHHWNPHVLPRTFVVCILFYFFFESLIGLVAFCAKNTKES